MEILQRVLFEWFYVLAVPLFLVNFFLLVYWRRSGRPRPLIIGLGVAAVLLLLQELVVTHREQAMRVLGPIREEVVLSRTAALERSLSPRFSSDGLDRDDFIQLARAGLARMRVRGLVRTALEVLQSQPESFVVSVTYFAREVEVGTSVPQPVKSKWHITFVREQGGWLIGGITAVEINNQAVRDLEELRTLSPP